MCRLYFAKKATDVNLLRDKFTILEKHMGGDGNGIALLGEEGFTVKKGVTVETKDLAQVAVESGRPFLFHTRSASIGGICDSLCQPFQIGQKNPVLVAHNGHWGYWEKGLDLLLTRGKMQFIPLRMSDSLVGAMLAKHYGPGALRNYIGEGVWLYATGQGAKLQVMAIVNSGNFAVNIETGEAASEPIFWAGKDTLYVTGDSVVTLYPKLQLIEGNLVDAEYFFKKRRKKK